MLWGWGRECMDIVSDLVQVIAICQQQEVDKYLRGEWMSPLHQISIGTIEIYTQDSKLQIFYVLCNQSSISQQPKNQQATAAPGAQSRLSSYESAAAIDPFSYNFSLTDCMDVVMILTSCGESASSLFNINIKKSTSSVI